MRLSHTSGILLLSTNPPTLHSLLTISVSSSANSPFRKSSIKYKISPNKVNFLLSFYFYFNFLFTCHLTRTTNISLLIISEATLNSPFKNGNRGIKRELSPIPQSLSNSETFLSMSHFKLWHILFLLASEGSNREITKTTTPFPHFCLKKSELYNVHNVHSSGCMCWAIYQPTKYDLFLLYGPFNTKKNIGIASPGLSRESSGF